MNRNIGGQLDWRTLAAPRSYDLKAQHHFQTLPADQQQAAVRRMAATGASDHAIAEATGLNVIYVRRLLAEAAA